MVFIDITTTIRSCFFWTPSSMRGSTVRRVYFNRECRSGVFSGSSFELRSFQHRESRNFRDPSFWKLRNSNLKDSKTYDPISGSSFWSSCDLFSDVSGTWDLGNFEFRVLGASSSNLDSSNFRAKPRTVFE
ncbi:uncharacterized protein LOC108740505 [Agrilus planipennis]|uniref:Uncharacterized protein LOC108740505 n=1 Tax=Agrilus planipennis TaxID=224129 RepID=A0A1W4XD35_AGRPL|nr:uncharacterized protein LOC108740505 [Agrilus planipennis]